jgi:hypothetical protein
MRLATLGVFATLCLLLASVASFAQTEPKDLLIGKWETREKMGDQELKITVEFTKDTVKASWDMKSIEGKYKWLDKENIEVTMVGQDGKDVTDKSKISVTKDELILTGRMDNKTTKFTRAK